MGAMLQPPVGREEKTQLQYYASEKQPPPQQASKTELDSLWQEPGTIP